MTEIVISEFMDEAAIREELGGFDVHYEPSLVDRRDSLIALLAGSRALIVRNRTQVDQSLLEAAPELRVVGRLGVGLDNIDLQACSARNIKVLPATGANDLAVAEYVITAALMLLRRSWFATGAMADGDWPRTELIGREASGKRIGLVGFGSIARETAARAEALGMQLAAHDPFLEPDDAAWRGVENQSLEALAAASDIVSLHVPLTDDTRHLVDANFLARMRPGAILINAARGGVVHERALVDALRAGKLGGAALDVFESEPLDAESAALFRNVPNLILTPHIAGVTAESNVRVSRLTAARVAGHLRKGE